MIDDPRLEITPATMRPTETGAQFRGGGWRRDAWGMRVILAVLMLLSTPALADTITTTEGAILEGKVIRELERGYLFRNAEGQTVVVPFEVIADVNIAPTAATLSPTNAPSFQLEKLRAERSALKERREGISIFWPIALMAVSGGLAAAPIGSTYSERQGYLLLGGLAFSGGLVWLIVNIARKVGLGNQIANIETELGRLGWRPED